jgi:hypothetical protein
LNANFIDDAARNDRNVREFVLACRLNATISWYRIPNTEWTVAEASARIAEAQTWFDRYCIHLTFEEFALDPGAAADRPLQLGLDREVAQYNARVALLPRGRAPQREALLDDVQASVNAISRLLRDRIGRQRLLVLFLDEWYVLTGVGGNPQGWRQHRVSANAAGELLIGIDRYDRPSTHMLTHELTHGLRKRGAAISNGRCYREFGRRNAFKPPTNAQLRPWHDHYAGNNQDRAMSRPARGVPFGPSPLSAARVLSLNEYFGIKASPLVRSVAECQCWEETRRPKRRPQRRK